MENSLNVLFVSSGNKKGGISPIVFNQGESLKRKGIIVDYYSINKKRWKGYAKSIISLFKVIRKGDYNIIHSHYSFCGFVATLASPFNPNIIVSLMGSFRKSSLKYYLIRWFAKYCWKNVIVKSERMKVQIGLKASTIIPNGVEIERFQIDKTQLELREELKLPIDKKIVIFVSNPNRPEKNFNLCKESVNLLNQSEVELVAVYDKPFEVVIKYMLTADVLMLTSLSEGSPNVIKEAMAANCPIVTTDVGDVRYLLNGVTGTFVMNTYSAKEGRDNLLKALSFNDRTLGREQLVKLQLSSQSVAARIIKIYQ